MGAVVVAVERRAQAYQGSRLLATCLALDTASTVLRWDDNGEHGGWVTSGVVEGWFFSAVPSGVLSGGLAVMALRSLVGRRLKALKGPSFFLIF